jgi:uncharacterized protein (DUF1810 family)
MTTANDKCYVHELSRAVHGTFWFDIIIPRLPGQESSPLAGNSRYGSKMIFVDGNDNHIPVRV